MPKVLRQANCCRHPRDARADHENPELTARVINCTGYDWCLEVREVQLSAVHHVCGGTSRLSGIWSDWAGAPRRAVVLQYRNRLFIELSNLKPNRGTSELFYGVSVQGGPNPLRLFGRPSQPDVMLCPSSGFSGCHLCHLRCCSYQTTSWLGWSPTPPGMEYTMGQGCSGS